MKIFIINQHKENYLGGSEIQCDIIASELIKLGHEVFYLAFSKERVFPKETHYTYRIIPFTLNEAEFEELLEKLNPDLVYWRHDRKGVYGILKITKAHGKRFVFAISHMENVLPEKIRFFNPFSFGSLRKCFRSLKNHLDSLWHYNHKYLSQIDGVTSQNPDHLFILPVKKQVYIPNSMYVNVSPFQWPRPFCVWVANIKSPKNPEIFIKLAQQISSVNVDFLMIGEITDSAYDWVRNPSNIPRNLHYLGPQPLEVVNGIIEKSLFLVHTCNPEGFCNNFVQAWLLGKPTITAFYDPHLTISTHRLGLYSGNFKTLVQDTYALIHNKKLRYELGNNALRYSALFNPAKNVLKLSRFFEQVVSC